MSAIDIQALLRKEDLSFDDLAKLRKIDLTAIAEHLKLEITQVMRKAEILDLVASHLQLSEDEEDQNLDQSKISDQTQIELANIQMKRDLEIKRMERESEKEQREMEMRKMELEFKMRELELTHAQTPPPKTKEGSSEFDLAKNIRLVPKFEENRVDAFFVGFEKVANNLKWPKESWSMLLQTVLTGKAADVYSSLSDAQSSDFEILKKAILNAYELVPEAYRHKFRNSVRKPGQTHVEFAREKEMMFDRWYRSLKVKEEFKNLKEVVVLEEFKKSVSFGVRSHLDDHKVRDVQSAALMADEYELTHKHDNRSNFRNFSGKRDKFQNSGQRNFGPGKDAQSKSDSSNSPPAHKIQSDKPAGQRPKVPICHYCGKKGHVQSQCFKLQNKNKEKKDMGFVMSKSVHAGNSVPLSDTQVVESHSHRFDEKIKQVSEGYHSFLFDGKVSPCSSGESGKPVVILRDTGANQSLMLDSSMVFPPDSAVNAHALVQTVDCSYMSVPLYKVDLKCDLVSGPVTVGVVPKLPMAGIDFLLGNDLAGDKVAVDPVVSEKPVEVAETEQLQEEFPGIFPDCVVTRSQARRAAQEDADSCDVEDSGVWLAETFFKDLDDRGVDVGSKASNDELFSKSSLVQAQQADSVLKGLSQTACSEAEAEKVPECYYVRDGILMRKWRPPLRPADEDWTVIHQIIVPPCYRKEILRIAHELPVGGHLGAKKTKDRIRKHFYWPKLGVDVAEFCRTCHTCQVVGKPQHLIKPAPLIPIPAFDEPFTRVLVDCVGPLPRTKSGHKYLLTIMDMSSRFPEAIPLRNITAKTVVEALVQFFTRYGLPKEVQSDQGSNFMSGVFQNVMYRLGITQLKSSAYHPQSQGALERYHQTLKTMIRAFCDEYPEDWDKGIPFLLFATRDSPSESTGFSPFELVYGHEVDQGAVHCSR